LIRFYLAGVLLLAQPIAALTSETVVLEPSQDNTLYETALDQDGQQFEVSNGIGSFLFAGRTGQDGGFKRRRALLQFDLLSILPADVEIVFAQLSMYQSKAAPDSSPVNMGLHPVLQQWGEAGSNASGPEGQGIQAETGDATWHHRIYPDDLWDTSGGSYAITPSAITVVGQLQQHYSWSCDDALLEDLRYWQNNPELNFGWAVIGGEAGSSSAHRFNSRQHSSTDQRPQLTIIYQAKGTVFSDSFEQFIGCP